MSNVRWMYFTDHSDGTECASCCDAFRTSWFPSLFEFVSFVVVGVNRNRGAGWTNSFCRFVWSKKGQYEMVSNQKKKKRKEVNLSLAEFSHTTVEGLGGQR